MARAGSTTTDYAAKMLSGAAGLPFSVAAAAERAQWNLSPVSEKQVIAQNVTAEVAERSAGASYPAFYIYCEKVSNQLREKFRTFSGKVKLAVDVRVSQDRLENIERQLELYVEAVTDVLDANRGDWGQGMFYTGGYEVSFGGTRHGGKNFVQSAKVTFEVDVSLA